MNSTQDQRTSDELLSALKAKATGPADSAVSAQAIIDLLLDMRGDAEDPGIRDEIDSVLSEIGRRPGMLLVCEVQEIHRRLGGG